MVGICYIIIVLRFVVQIYYINFIKERKSIEFVNAQNGKEEEIVPYAEWRDVPSYQYMLKHYDGSVTVMPVVYKQINVPSGCKVVSNGPTLAYYETDAYYQGTRYAAVSRYEWTHSVVSE